MKVVINSCFGGFSLSPEATLKLWELGGPVEATPVEMYFSHEADPDSIIGKKRRLQDWREYLSGVDKGRRPFLTVFSPDESLVLNSRDADRSNPLLVKVVEELGEKADGAYASLTIVEIPDDAEWQVEEYDGNEHIAEKHRTWS